MQGPDRRIFRYLLLLLDLLALIGAFELAVETRIYLNPFYSFQMTRTAVDHLVPPIGLILLLWLPMSAWLEIYRPRGSRLVGSIGQVLESVVALSVLTIVVTFFVTYFGSGFSRTFVLFFMAWSLVTLMISRGILWAAIGYCQRRGYLQERVAIAGGDRGTKELSEYLERSRPPGVDLCGVISTARGGSPAYLGNPVPVLGSIEDIGGLINTHRIDRVIALEGEMDEMQLQTLAATCTRMDIPLHRLPSNLEMRRSRVRVHRLGSLNLLEVHGLQFTRRQEAVKRGFDICVGTALLAAMGPLMLALAVLIKMTSRGPVLYVAPRAGKGGKHFPFYKFRSMVRDAEARREQLGGQGRDGHIFKIKDDPRLTAIGRLMRRFSLDELPQLVNVIKGDMSLVGPRPLPAHDLDADGLSTAHEFWARERTRVLPGITGLWQVQGRSDLGFEDMIRYDIEYARTWSVARDLQILLMTLPAVLRGRGAY